MQSNWGALYFFFRTYISLYQILSCTVVKALLFWVKLYLCAELTKSLNMLINHNLLLYWRPRKLICEFCIHLQESWKPHSLNSLTMGSEDTSSQEQQHEAKWKQQRRKLCFCAHCKRFPCSEEIHQTHPHDKMGNLM